MIKVYAGALLFALPHLLASSVPSAKARLKQRLGEGGYKGLFSLLSAAGLVLMGLGYVQATPGTKAAEMVRAPWAGGLHLYLLLVFLAFVLLAAAHGKGYIRLMVRHPMSLGVMLWAGSHLMANGERNLMWLFGSVFAVGLADFVLSWARGKKPAYEPRVASDVVAIAAGLVVYLIFLFGFHPFILGVPVFK